MSHSTRKDGPGCAQRRRRVHGTPTPNGRRSSFRDWAAEATDHPREVVEAALAHRVRNQIEAAYRRTDLFERRRRLMDDWADYLAGETPEPEAAPSRRRTSAGLDLRGVLLLRLLVLRGQRPQGGVAVA